MWALGVIRVSAGWNSNTHYSCPCFDVVLSLVTNRMEFRAGSESFGSLGF